MQHGMPHAVQTSTLSDVLERVLDKGIVIAGDIKVKLVDIELLSLQIRLVICSVDKAREMGMDWWVNNPVFARQPESKHLEEKIVEMQGQLSRLEAALNPVAGR
jgi:gas vesicle protein GvpA/GvpJ/GvpM family